MFNHVPGPCTIVKGADHGSEDIELLSDGTALISSGKMGRIGRTERDERENSDVRFQLQNDIETHGGVAEDRGGRIGSRHFQPPWNLKFPAAEDEQRCM